MRSSGKLICSALSPQARGWSCTSAATGTGAALRPRSPCTMGTWRRYCWTRSTSPDGAAPRAHTVTGGCACGGRAGGGEEEPRSGRLSRLGQAGRPGLASAWPVSQGSVAGSENRGQVLPGRVIPQAPHFWRPTRPQDWPAGARGGSTAVPPHGPCFSDGLAGSVSVLPALTHAVPAARLARRPRKIRTERRRPTATASEKRTAPRWAGGASAVGVRGGVVGSSLALGRLWSFRPWVGTPRIPGP